MQLFFDLALPAEDRAGRRLRRADHVQLVHEARVRQEADRGASREARPHARRRHDRRLHPRSRHADGDPRWTHRDPVAPTACALSWASAANHRRPPIPRKGSSGARFVESGRPAGYRELRYVTVADVPRERSARTSVEHRRRRGRRPSRHRIETASTPLRTAVERIGVFGMTHAEDIMLRCSERSSTRRGCQSIPSCVR